MTNPTPPGQVPATAADGKTKLFNFPGHALMVQAVDFNRLHAENEALRAAHVQNPAEIEHVAGDVSKNGAEVNMAPQPAPSAAAMSPINRLIAYSAAATLRSLGYQWDEATEAWKLAPSPTTQADSAHVAAPADTVVLDAAWRAIHQAIDLIGEPNTERLRTVRRVLRGAVVVAEDSTTPQADSQPAPVLDSLALMKVVMQADEALVGRCTRGTTNWAAAIGKAVQDAVLAARKQGGGANHD